MMAVPVETDPTFSVLGDAEVLFDRAYFMFASRRTYDVAPDGRFLMLKESSGEPDRETGTRIDVVLNWTKALNTPAPTAP